MEPLSSRGCQHHCLCVAKQRVPGLGWLAADRPLRASVWVPQLPRGGPQAERGAAGRMGAIRVRKASPEHAGPFRFLTSRLSLSFGAKPVLTNVILTPESSAKKLGARLGASIRKTLKRRRCFTLHRLSRRMTFLSDETHEPSSADQYPMAGAAARCTPLPKWGCGQQKPGSSTWPQFHNWYYLLKAEKRKKAIIEIKNPRGEQLADYASTRFAQIPTWLIDL